MNHTELIDKLLRELSYRVGIVDLKNKNQQSIISEILTEWNEYDAKTRIMEFLTEAPADTEGDDKDYTHLGAGIYVRKGDEDKDSSQKYKKDDSGSLKAISDDEYQKTKSAQGQDGEKAAETTPQNQQGGDTQQTEEPPKGTSLKQGGYYKIIDKEAETRKKIDSENNSEDEKNGTAVKKLSKQDKEFERLKSLPKQELRKIDHDTTDEQLNMTKTEAELQAKQTGSKDVGAGTAESRAGEAMVHKGLRLLQSGKSLEEIQNEFDTLVNQPDHILNSKSGKAWVKASLSTLRKIDETVGIKNIKEVSWDTPAGRIGLGIDPKLDTSSDMFVQTKDGKNIGLSLKKDGKVFLNNGGWAKQSELLLQSLEAEMPKDDHDRLSEAMSIQTYKKDLENRFVETTNGITSDVIDKSFKRLLDNPADQKEFKGSSKDEYFKILGNSELLIKKIKLGTATGNEQKAYAKLLQTYHTDQYNHLRESDNGLTQRAFEVLNQSEEAKKGMNRHIIKSMHISETLGLNKRIQEGGVDGFQTMYGIDPDGAVLNEQTLVTLFGSKFKQKLDEIISEVRSGNSSYKDLEDFIVDSIEIDYESGQILFKHESNKKYPLFKMAGRTRGIGSSPVMEMVQTPFMAHALKMGTFNTDEWDSKSLNRFQKDIIDSDGE
jgi:hypothetical protein